MKRTMVRGLIAGSLISLTFFSCSKHDVAQTKNYQEILYGSAAGKNQPATVNQPTIIHASADRKPELVLIDTNQFLLKREISLFTEPYLNNKIAGKVAEFYRANHFQTKWLYDVEPAELYYSLISNLKSAEAFGLNAQDYNSENLETAIQSVYENSSHDQKEIMALDIRISEIFFLFTTHLGEGKIRNVGFSNNLWLREENKKNAVQDVALLVSAKDQKDLNEAFDKIQPSNEQYKKLQAALEHYRNLERYAVETLPQLYLSGKIERESHHKVIPLVRKRLSQVDLKVYPLTMDTTTGVWDSLLYDKGLVQGIVAFQIRHGLEPDGVIGPKTITFLNQNLKDRVGAIAVNMDRIRWTPEFDKSSEYILVNVPEYKLYIYDNSKEVFEMRVIVGALDNPTPIFNDRINHIVFSPTWTVPVSIIKNEIIPRLKSNPEYYNERNYVFYKNGAQIDPASEPWGTTQPHEYRIVQQSGGDNSLGRVKFGMNNAMRIYLHDTPSQRLFAKDFRALSHGCIRLDEPARFAEYLLKDNSGWDVEKINKQMSGDKASTIMLKKNYPVKIQYCTAWVSEDGSVNFREDIYGHDRMQLQQLAKPVVKATGIIAGL
jgi:L,D-transpeptidase YcbB